MSKLLRAQHSGLIMEDKKQLTSLALVIGATVVAVSFTAYFLFTKDDTNQQKEAAPSPTESYTQQLEQQQISEPASFEAIEEDNILIDEVIAGEASIITTSEPQPALESTPQAKPLLPKNIESSDSWLAKQLTQLSLTQRALALFTDEDIISKFVVFIDNAANGELSEQNSPLVSPHGKFATRNYNDQEQTYVLDPKSYKRYDMYANLISTLPSDNSIALYKSMKPLLHSAYQELGYEDDDFDEKLNNAIDLALAAPVVEGQIKLIAPSANYQFADPELEELKPIQKLLIRMGPKNQLKVQASLAKLSEQIQ